MLGYAGKLLRVDLSRRKISQEDIPDKMKEDFLGGRGFAVKLLWDEVKHVDPLSGENKLIFATGPLTGQAIPSPGKLVIASKSPLTGGYGDGNIGTMASLHLRKAGYDVVVIEGKAETPCYLLIEDDRANIVNAPELWGKNTFEAEDLLENKHGKNLGILVIGPGGENLVRFANVMSQKGRAGGRPGMGAVMGSKQLKAIVVRGSGTIRNADDSRLKELGKKGYEEIKAKENYDFWIRQGTMQVVEWCNENACLPTHNFREGVFDHSKELDGFMVEKLKVNRKGCPLCNMQCGNVINDTSNQPSELDYENVAMLGSNIGMKDLRQVAFLNRMADEWGLDTISLGNSIAFLMEASEKGILSDKIKWGDFQAVQRLILDIGKGTGLGKMASQGVRRAAEALGNGSSRWAMQVKGLEISAYNCHACPGMALSFATSPIGASHKDAWIIAWEVSTDRSSYDQKKVEKLLEFQRIRGGLFEAATVCRLPWVEVGFGIHWYPQYMEAVTGKRFSLEDFYEIGDRIYSLIRAYWIREQKEFNRLWDYPPERWFEEAPSQGKLKGVKLDKEKYDRMLSLYYELRGWNDQGVPLKETLDRLGLHDVSREIYG